MKKQRLGFRQSEFKFQKDALTTTYILRKARKTKTTLETHSRVNKRT